MMRFLPITLFLLLCAAFAAVIITRDNVSTLPSALIGKTLPDLTLTSMDGKPVNLNAHVAGKPAIINVFASWCIPCLQEHKLWVDVSTKQKIPLIGIAWKDSPENVRAWLKKHGNPYSLVLVDTTGASTIPLGITGVPETYVVDAQQAVRYKLSMPVSEDALAHDVLPLVTPPENP